MAKAISSATNLTSDFFMKSFYQFNRKAIKNSDRRDYNHTELSYEDSRALKRAASKLSSFTYTKEDNGDNLVSTIEAFAKTYNNTLESSSSTDSDTYRQNRQLKALTKKYEKELKDIGITLEDDGKLSVSENILKGSSYKEIRKVFSEDSDYVQKLRTISRRMHNTSYEEVYAQMTGSGGKLNIVL